MASNVTGGAAAPADATASMRSEYRRRAQAALMKLKKDRDRFFKSQPARGPALKPGGEQKWADTVAKFATILKAQERQALQGARQGFRADRAKVFGQTGGVGRILSETDKALTTGRRPSAVDAVKGLRATGVNPFSVNKAGRVQREGSWNEVFKGLRARGFGGGTGKYAARLEAEGGVRGVVDRGSRMGGQKDGVRGGSVPRGDLLTGGSPVGDGLYERGRRKDGSVKVLTLAEWRRRNRRDVKTGRRLA